ncbi:MAG: pepsin-like aspartic protease, partial [Polyangiaceae bacterium]
GGGGGHDGGGTTGDGGGGGDDGGTGGDDGSSPEGSVTIDAGAPGDAVKLYYCLGGVYSAETTVGSQKFELNIDTGSGDLGVASATCSNCGVTPEYTPGSTATDEKGTVNAAYGSGSWTGEIYQDDVGLGSETAFPLKFGAMTSQNQFLQPQFTVCNSPNGSMQGILGMGPNGATDQGVAEYFGGLVSSQKVPNVFAAELCDSGGTLWLGGVGDSSLMTAAPQYTPMTSGFSNYYYAVTLSTVQIDGKTTQITSGQNTATVVDTGTSTFLLTSTAYTGIVNSITGSAGFKGLGASAASLFPSAANSGQISCANLAKTAEQLDAVLPPMIFTFGANPSVTVTAPASQSYLFPLQGEWCSGLSGVAANQIAPLASIFGSPMHRSSIIIYDRAGARIGFAPHKPCL